MFRNLATGGGQNRKENKPRGRPAGEALLQHISSTAPAPLLSADISQLQYPTIPLNEQLDCQMCGSILNGPVELSCGAIVPAAQRG